MRKQFLLAILAFFVQYTGTLANHIAGGELFYEYLGPGLGANTSKYRITMRLFRPCDAPPSSQTLETETVTIGIYTDDAQRQLYESVFLSRVGNVSSISRVPGSIPCLSGEVDICYQIGIFRAEIDLPKNANGYILSWIRYSRPNSVNIVNPKGATFITHIPGTAKLPTGNNSSPQFVVRDTVLVCRNSGFVLDFSAVDRDGDSLSYQFCGAFQGGSEFNANPLPPGQLTLRDLGYSSPYSGASPLGASASVDPVTGIISGIAPLNTGGYVVNVCVTEWRNGRAINEHRKDFIMRVENCEIPQARLSPVYLNCEGLTLNFQNQSTASNIHSYFWDFGVKSSTTDTSSQPVVSYTFPDTGSYTVTLITNRGNKCSDTGYAIAKVYPGFKAAIGAEGQCYKNPFSFNDVSGSNNGNSVGWQWNFGDDATVEDTSSLRNPAYTYLGPGTRTVMLVVVNDKGCIDTATTEIVANDKPAYDFPFKDTLICSIDTLQLQVNTSGAVAWQPNSSNILLNPNSNGPLVFPKTSTWFSVNITQNGCAANDSVLVNVIDNVNLDIGPDVNICLTDSVQFFPQTNALYFAWSPSATLHDTTFKNAVATPVNPVQQYHLVASVGKCSNEDDIIVSTFPYPEARAFGDTSICYGDFAQLTGIITRGDNFTWSPELLLRDANTLTPRANPNRPTDFVFTVTNNSGCLKPVRDTVEIDVKPPVQANAGRDTMIVINQPLQLNATGGNSYQWSPAVGMSNPSIADPVVTLNSFYDTVVYKVRVGIVPPGCYAEDQLRVIVFKTLPDIFVPTAFTPNSDGRNDVIKPIVVGMQKFNYFRVFNRWGQMLYQTNAVGMGWNGVYGGQEQPPGTYVYMAQAVDYEGKLVNRKGTIVLIR
ncbi:PKD domain-containing protein [Foetidibacter luteolus]|uniref:PKD domain-containing protein n=1 Tax=Foetidibacter luteolus TaxID=2608880 RepID=UPI00129A629C|nr:PKD domain-containing protein [Foetidibacter luteolus]